MASRSRFAICGKPATYGFGISIEKYRGAEAFGHGGADAGYRADVVQFPAHHLEIAVACNFADATPNTYSRAVADIVLEGTLEPRAAETKRATVVSAARLGQLAGVYKASNSDQVFVLSLKDGKLVIDNFGLPLEPVDDSHFTVFGTPVEFAGPALGVPVAIKIAATGDSG